MPIHRLPFFQRVKALALLGRGKSRKDVAGIMRERYHPRESLEEVERKYFPKKGTFAIGSLEGAPRERLLARLAKMKAARQGMKNLYKKPDFAEANRRRMRQRNLNPEFKKKSVAATRRRHQDPEFAKANRARMAKLRENPEVSKRREEAIVRYLNTLHLRAREEQAKRGIEPGWEERDNKMPVRNIATTRTPRTTALQKELTDAIDEALGELPPLEREVVSARFGFTEEEVTEFKKIARNLRVGVREAEAAFNEAMEKLGRNKRLAELGEELVRQRK